MQAKKIVLIGYMGSGKSTIGKLLATDLQYEFIDLDNYIEEQEGDTIANIFKSKGEIYFRKKEHYYLKQVLTLDYNVILSLGGGTPCFAGNMDIIKAANANSIYLKLSIPSLIERLMPERSERPLIAHTKTEEELVEFIGKHLFERSFYYNQADHIVAVAKETPAELIETIKIKLN